MNIYKLPNNTLTERIKQHYLTGYEISEADDLIRQRWAAAHALVMNRESDAECARILAKRYKITTRQAYTDIRDAKDLFGDVRRSSKDAIRYMVTQWAIQLFKKAESNEDYYAAAKALEKIIKVNNLDKEDQDLPDPSKIQPPVQMLSINFNFINSVWFEKIDPKAKEVLLDLHKRITAMIMESPASEYLNLIQSPPQLEEPDGD